MNRGTAASAVRWNWVLRVLRVAVGLAGGVVIASWVVVAAAHVDDTYNVDHVAGAWLALADAASDGELYPPLYEDGRFGGTRYMPLPILLYGGAVRLGGNELVSAKLLAYAVAALLLTLVCVVLRRLGCDWSLALAFTATILVWFTGLFAATTVYGDALPVLFQLGALALVARSTSRWSVAAAGLLAALAPLSKLSAIWGLLAVGAYLLLRDRRKLPIFMGVAAVAAGFGLALAEAASDGRMSDNLLELAFAGGGGLEAILLDAPRELGRLLTEFRPPSWLLVPLAVIGTGLSVARRTPDVFQLGFVGVVLVVLVVLSDQGAGFNHLMDVVVMLAVVAGGFAATIGARGERQPLVSAVLLVAVLAALVGSYQERLRYQTREALGMLLGDPTPAIYDPTPVDGVVRSGETLFSEDPYVPVSLGERPVVGDPYMLLRIAKEHPEWRADLLGRIERREFDKLVLMFPLDLSDPWWRESHLGIEIATALAREYRPAGRVVGAFDYYRIYVPRERPGGDR